MNNIDLQRVPKPPRLTTAILSGFDATTNHLGLIFFPICLDILLWLGPHLSISPLIKAFLDQTSALPQSSSSEASSIWQANQELWQMLAERFNLFSVLRTYPVGIPSLMVTRSPKAIPGGDAYAWQVGSLPAAIGMWLGLSLIGLLVGTFFFSLVSQAAIGGETDWTKAFMYWPWASSQVILLGLFWLSLFLLASLPFSCLLSILFVIGVGPGQVALLLFGLLLLLLLLPLVFSPHGIFVYHLNMWQSLRAGLRMIRVTLPGTALLLLMILLLSQGLDILWQLPAETSWLSLVGVVGHAFTTTGLLAATFVYYHEAIEWIKKLQQLKTA